MRLFVGLSLPALSGSVMTRGAILLHVVNHGSYHRGWIAEMFYEMPRKPPATDLPVYLARNATGSR